MVISLPLSIHKPICRLLDLTNKQKITITTFTAKEDHCTDIIILVHLYSLYSIMLYKLMYSFFWGKMLRINVLFIQVKRRKRMH